MNSVHHISKGLIEVQVFSREECLDIAQFLKSSDLWVAGRVLAAVSGNRKIMESKRKQKTISLSDCPEKLKTFADNYLKAIEPYLGTFLAYQMDAEVDLCQYQLTEPGGYFHWHRDQKRDKQRIAAALLYLSDAKDGLIGGSTDFNVDGKIVPVYPELGKVVIFDPNLKHRGAEVIAGCKYGLIVIFAESTAKLNAVEKIE